MSSKTLFSLHLSSEIASDQTTFGVLDFGIDCSLNHSSSRVFQRRARFWIVPPAQAWDAVRVNQALQAVIVRRALRHLRRGLADMKCHAATSFAFAEVQT